MPAQSTEPILEPGIKSFVDSLARAGGPPIYTLSPTAARNVLRDAQSGASVRLVPVDIEERAIPGGPTGDVSVRIYRPKGKTGVLPAVVYIHGGGWILGDKDTHDRLLRELTKQADAAFIFVNYTPSPEARFPIAIEQSYAVARWGFDHGAEAKLDSKRLALAGDSVGGNMVAALTLMAKERGGPKFISQLMFYPVTDANFETESYKTFAEGPWLSRNEMKWFWDAYLPDVGKRSDIFASPLRASIEQLRGLPPALLIVNENDVLRDEGEAYARKLDQAGVPVVANRYIGTIHDFVMLNGLAQTNATHEAVSHAARWIKDKLYPH